MPEPNPAALAFLLSRRSRPPRALGPPAPDDAALEPILTAALRVPDHGKLEPWRLIVLRPPALARLAAAMRPRAAALALDPDAAEKSRAQIEDAQLVVAVVESPVLSAKIPAIEQSYSAGAVCLGLVNAALASGWGAVWLSGWIAHDRPLVEGAPIALAPHERVAGLIHIGTERAAPPERPRPDLAAKVSRPA